MFLKPYHLFKIWVVDKPLHLGLTVTDKHLSLGLNKKIGNAYGNAYDSAADMFSTDPAARGWAENLFQYYLGRAVTSNYNLKYLFLNSKSFFKLLILNEY